MLVTRSRRVASFLERSCFLCLGFKKSGIKAVVRPSMRHALVHRFVSDSRFFALALALSLIVTAAGCRKRNNNAQGSSGVRSGSTAGASSGATGAGQVELPAPGGKMYVPSEAEKQAIVDAMMEVKRAFYDTTEGYDDPKPSAPPNYKDETSETREVSPKRWSDLMTHYYGKCSG